MKKFRHILVAACPGFLEVPVLKRAAQVATVNGAKLTVLDVVEPIPRRRRIVNADGKTFDLQALLIDDRRRHLGETVESAGLDDVVVQVVAGKPFIEVTRYAIGNECDLVVVGESPTREGEARMVAPDVTQLIRACPTPVWVMCPSRAPKLRILALVDPDPTNPVHNSLNHAILELATAITSWEDGELHVAHAWQLSGESKMRSPLLWGIPATEVDAMVEAIRDESAHELETLAERHRVFGLGGKTHLVRGDAQHSAPRVGGAAQSQHDRDGHRRTPRVERSDNGQHRRNDAAVGPLLDPRRETRRFRIPGFQRLTRGAITPRGLGPGSARSDWRPISQIREEPAV